MKAGRILPFAVLVLAILFSAATENAYAAGGFFGVQERIQCLQPLDIDAPAGVRPLAVITDLNRPKYDLCHKYSMYFFFAGVYLHDDGYVLAEGDNAFRYVPLDNARIAELQGKGVLPNTLPTYSIPWSQYIIGYSLWLLFGVVAAGTWLWAAFKRWKNKGKKCLRCELILTPYDFKTGRCGSCGEPVPLEIGHVNLAA